MAKKANVKREAGGVKKTNQSDNRKTSKFTTRTRKNKGPYRGQGR